MPPDPAPATTGRHIIPAPWLRWLLLVGGWAAFGLFMATEGYLQAARSKVPLPWEVTLRSEMIYAAIWLLLTPGILWVAWKVPFHARRWARAALLHLGATALFAFLHRFLFNVAIELVLAGEGRPFRWETVFESLTRYLDYGIMIYWILVLSRQAIVYYRGMQEQALVKSQLEAQLNMAQLRALKSQLQPHFLFNTLNGISALVRKDPDLACAMIARLADLLRITLENTGAQEIPLDQELRTLECYLEIERMRFADRLQVVVEIDDDAKRAYVPNLILQPLVENALRHGVARQRGPASIAIRARREDRLLRLSVEDTGPGLPAGGAVREGIGLSNTRSRLAQLYRDEFTFTMESGPSPGVAARITLPFHTAALA